MRQLTIEQYFEHEERSEDRHEYSNGEIFVMSGDTLEHNTIVINLVSELRPYCQDVRLWVEYSLPSLQEYLLISQDEIRVRHHQRQASNRWLFTELTDPRT